MGEDRQDRGLGEAMKYFVEELSKKQTRALKALGPHMAPGGFYLAGGTAVANHSSQRLAVKYRG